MRTGAAAVRTWTMAGAALVAASLSWVGSGAAAEPTVRVAGGVLEGRLAPDGVRTFKGVPYARAPVGERRWKPPEAAEAWSGVRRATEAGDACMQPNAGPRGFYTDPPPRMSEDCLFLNVWAPAAAKGAPVMVYIHGGALVTGHGGSPRYDGAKLARDGVVVVTINYRLGIFGFLAHPELSAESPHRASGNYGTLDQIAALCWVQENIATFGGDPKRVTVFGQSAGAHSVYLLMATPLASGLFQKAVAQSGYLPAMFDLRRPMFGSPSAEEVGRAFATRAGAGDLAGLRAMSPEALLTAASDNPSSAMGATASPVVDGWVHPMQLYEAFEQGRQAKVPLVAGFTSGEMLSFDPGVLPAPTASASDYEARIRAAYGDDAARYLEVYPARSLAESSLAAARDAYFGWGTEQILRLHRRSGAPAWLYYFDHVYPSAEARGVGAFHSSDVPFVFGNVGPGAIAPKNWPSPPAGAEDIALSRAMMDYWVAFARTGRPAAPRRPAWPAFTDVDGAYLAFRQGRAVPATHLLPGMFEVQDAHMGRLRARGQAWVWTNTGAWAPPLAKPD